MKKGLNKIIILLIILIAHSCQMSSQIKTDTVDIGKKNIIIISYPEKSKVSNTYYEEGVFRDITCIEDTVLVGIHFGGMAYIDFANSQFMDSQEINISSEYVIANDFRQTRGFYYLNGEKKFFREDNVYKYGLDFYYFNVPEDKISFYESLLNSIKYLENKND